MLWKRKAQKPAAKTDAQLRQDVQDELAWEPSIRDAEIAVAVKDGVVTLAGHVDSFAEKHTAQVVVERVAGVRAIADDLTVDIPTSWRRSDVEIAHAAVTALDADVQVPDGIKAIVDEGWITLEGSVEWQYQRQAAERAVRYLTGVVGVTNFISVKPPRASAFEVSTRIREALRRSAEHDAERITIEAADGRVTLTGWVRSYAERQDAERAAWSAPGVLSVDDRLSVNP